MPKRVPESREQSWAWQLKIELLGVTPSVWRRITVPETIPNSHLHEFIIGGVRYADPDPDIADELGHVDQKYVVLLKALGRDSRCFDYVYDFGDDWHHIVIVEAQVPDGGVAPSLVHCSDGANSCPPEDVGSTRGYAELAAISILGDSISTRQIWH